jgi:hypothetical protein
MKYLVLAVSLIMATSVFGTTTYVPLEKRDPVLGVQSPLYADANGNAAINLSSSGLPSTVYTSDGAGGTTLLSPNGSNTTDANVRDLNVAGTLRAGNNLYLPAARVPINITVNTSLSDVNTGQVFDVNGDVNLTLPQAKNNSTWSVKIRAVKTTFKTSVKPFSGDNIVRLTNTALAADACSVATGSYAVVLFSHYPQSDDINKDYEEANNGNWTP